jgi:hypothetical protein
MKRSGGLADEADLSVITPPNDDPYFGENQALWFWDEEHRYGIHTYLKTLRHLGKYELRRETVNVHLPDGTVLMVDQDGPGTVDPRIPRGPNLICECVEPFERWRFRYDATGQPATATEMQEGLLRHMPLVPVAFELETTMAADPWRPALDGTGHGDTQRALGFIGGERYEQLLTATGVIRTQDGEVAVRGGGMRTHRVGMRNTGTMPGHTWLTATFPSGRGFSFMRYCGADGVPIWESAFVEEGSKRVEASILDAPLFSAALPGEPLDLELESPAGRASIHGLLRATNFVTNMNRDPFRFCWGIDSSDPSNRIMSQGLARYEWDGEVGAGMIERSVRVFEMPPIPR